MNERVTVEVDAETLARAREAGVDLSHLLERAIRRELPLVSDAEWERAKQWYRQKKSRKSHSYKIHCAARPVL